MAIAYRSSSKATNSSTNSLTVTAPSGIVNGDILVAVAYINGTQTVTAPAGWTQIDVVNPGTYFTARLYAFWKRASGESGDYTFSGSTTTRMYAGIAVFSGCLYNGTPVDVYSSAIMSGSSNTNLDLTAITTTVANTMIVAVAGCDGAGTGNTFNAPTGFSTALTTTNREEPLAYYKAQAAAGSTGTVTCTSTGIQIWAGILIALKPTVPTNFLMMF